MSLPRLSTRAIHYKVSVINYSTENLISVWNQEGCKHDHVISIKQHFRIPMTTFTNCRVLIRIEPRPRLALKSCGLRKRRCVDDDIITRSRLAFHSVAMCNVNSIPLEVTPFALATRSLLLKTGGCTIVLPWLTKRIGLLPLRAKICGQMTE